MSKTKPVDPIAVAKVIGALGGTDSQLAAALGINRAALNKRMKKNRALVDTLKEAKAEADAKVEKALFQRATGYEHEDTHFSSYEGEVTATPYTRHYPPDVVACIFWLKNRKPEQWRERSDTHISLTQIAGIPDHVLVGLKRLALISADEATRQLKDGLR